MFDVQKVKELGQAIISFDGQTVYLHGNQVTDEKTKEEARIASLVYEEAAFEFTRLAQQKKEGISFDRLVESIIHKYGLNGEISSDPENKAIDTLLQHEHIEIPLMKGSLIDSDYRILAHTEKRRGLAVLKRCAQKRGFDIEELALGFDPKARILQVDYKKIPLNKTVLPFGLTLNDKIEDAHRHLKEATKNDDQVMIQYYSDLLNSYKNIPSNKKANLTYAEVQDLKSKSEPTPAKWQETQSEEGTTYYEYPATDDLQKLYAGKMSALQKKNEALASHYDKALMLTLTSYPITMTPEIWQHLSREGKKQYYSLKILEAKILNRQEALTYWSGALKKIEIEEKKI